VSLRLRLKKAFQSLQKLIRAKMWFVYASLILAIIGFALRKYGWNLYRLGGRPIFLRRLLPKVRAATPPLEDRRKSHSNEHSVFQVFDDGTIISSKIEKPQMVNDFYFRFKETFSQCNVDKLHDLLLLTFKWSEKKLLTSQSMHKCEFMSRSFRPMLSKAY
jgi:hypothetical protein